MKGMIEATKTYHFALNEEEMQELARDLFGWKQQMEKLPDGQNIISPTSNMVLEMVSSTKFNRELFD